MTRAIKRIAIIGTGVTGASWAALFLAKDFEVVATDVAPDADASLKISSRRLGRLSRDWASHLLPHSQI
jgi:3-hydroxyacyl-CoA dehydrogenase